MLLMHFKRERSTSQEGTVKKVASPRVSQHRPPWQDMAVSSLAGCIAALLVAASYVFLPMCFPHTMAPT